MLLWMLTSSLSVCMAMPVDSLMLKGNEAYLKNQYQEALAAYLQIDSVGFRSADLYYNMGNSYFKMGMKSEALLWYERALRLNPSNEDIQHNIAFVNQHLIDKIETLPQLFIVAWYNQISGSLTSNNWAIISLCAMILLAAMLVLFFVSTRRPIRKCAVSLFFVAVFIAVLSIFFAHREKNRYVERPEAIIMEKVVSAKSSPSENSKELFVIHEGLKVVITDQIGSFYEIKLPNGEKGWVVGENIAVI
jgi:tetratricopeptide (TPR) repeat protein